MTSKIQEMENEKGNTNNSANNKDVHRWSTNETKYLLDQYRIYFPQIGPFRAFKNKAVMFEQISKDLFTKFDITVTGQQCLNRFKNCNKRNRNASLANKVSGNVPIEGPYDDELEEIKSIDDSLKPEVLVGVNHVKINEKVKVNIKRANSDIFDTSDSKGQQYEESRKKLKSHSLEQVLREISATSEENREIRHKEKCNLLVSLLGKPTNNSE